MKGLHRAPRYDESQSRLRMDSDGAPTPIRWVLRHWVRLTLATISAAVAIGGVLLYGLHR